MCTKQVVYKSLPMMEANLVRSDKNIYIRNDEYFQLRVYIERLKPWREALIDAETRQQRFKFFVNSTFGGKGYVLYIYISTPKICTPETTLKYPYVCTAFAPYHTLSNVR